MTHAYSESEIKIGCAILLAFVGGGVIGLALGLIISGFAELLGRVGS